MYIYIYIYIMYTGIYIYILYIRVYIYIYVYITYNIMLNSFLTAQEKTHGDSQTQATSCNVLFL